jgi:hypothetical protein
MYEDDPNDDLSAILAPDDASNGDASSDQADISEEPTFKIIKARPESEPKKKYSHKGKRHRAITADLFRCTFVTKVVSDELSCGALLWKYRTKELREHLLLHLPFVAVSAMTDQQVIHCYQQAKSFTLEPMPDDAIHGITPEDLDIEGDTPDE